MGHFIAIEGGDGSGKGTQSMMLSEWATEQGLDVLKISFPQYGEPSAYYAEKYLNGVYGDANNVPADLGVLPFAIDRFAAKEKIKKHLEKPSSLVIADRYMASNLAHQGTKVANANDRKAFYSQTLKTEYEVLAIPRPSKNIVLIVPTAIAQKNVDKKATRSYTDKKRDIHEADANHLELAKRNYSELCEIYPEEFTAIECMSHSSLRSIEDIQQEIRLLISGYVN